ncbi:hypothetical protein HRbin29_01255 [bacterium HR29]|nr:hypothetical protein HRbin29_01255 [bacterium HR29]
MIVVGAGPAGSTTARELAAAGVRVLLLEGERLPRYKACGGGVPLRTARMLPFPLGTVAEAEVRELELSLLGRHRFVRNAGRPFALMVMRDRFDALLAEHAQRAGAVLREAAFVRSIEFEPARIRVRADGFQADASFLVGADGARSLTARAANLGVGLAECAAWEVELRPRANVHTHRAAIELGYCPWGYAWAFPKAGRISAGIVLPLEQARALKSAARRFLERLGLGAAEVERARGHKLRFRRGREPIADERVLLVGDAAGLADEFTQEGIAYAVASGRLAAKALLAALSGQGDARTYERLVDEELMPELRAARRIARIFYGGLRRAPLPWFGAARFLPPLWSSFFAVQRGESTYARETARLEPLAAAMERLLR